jgi:putative peptidoglycan lipid II flippase
VRDRLVLTNFGANVYLDAFYVALGIPNLVREMLAEGSLGSAFTKVFAEISTEDEARAKKLLQDSIYLMILVGVALSMLGIVAAPWIVQLMTMMTPDTEDGRTLVTTATGLARLLFPFLGFMIVASVAMGALHQKRKFFLTAAAPMLFNVGYIFGAAVLSYWMAESGPEWVETYFQNKAVTGLAVGVLLGGLGQLLIQIWGIGADLRGMKLKLKPFPFSNDLKKVFILMGPMVLASSAGQINQIINRNFATSLEAGSVTWLYSAFRLLHMPIGIFGVAIGVATLPALTEKLTRNKFKFDELASKEAQVSIELVLWLMLPCFVFFHTAGLDLITLIYQGGAFTAQDSMQVYLALGMYSFAVFGYGLNKVFTSIYFAVDRTDYAMRVSFISIAINFVTNYLMVEKYGHVGLAMAFTATISVNTLLLMFGLRRENILINWARLGRSVGLIVVSGAVAYGLSFYIGQLMESQVLTSWGATGRAFTLCLTKGVIIVICGTAAASVYLKTSPMGLIMLLRRSK